MCRSTHDANELALFVSREPHHADALLQVGGRVSTMPYTRALRAPRFQHARPPPPRGWRRSSRSGEVAAATTLAPLTRLSSFQFCGGCV